MNAYFVYTKYYDFNTNRPTVGGVQTYLQGLFPIFTSLGYSCHLYQLGDQEASVILSDGTTVRQVNTAADGDCPKQIHHLVQEIMRTFCDQEDMLLFMANELTCPNTATRSIAIQHGISWDSLSNTYRPEWRQKIGFAFKAKRSYEIIRKLYDVKHLVCVDHNFPNWLRATTPRFHLPMTVIPNFTPIAPKPNKPTDEIRIIFARRFFPYRGTRLFAPAMATILSEFPQVRVTVAGSGPDADYIRQTLAPYRDRVCFTQYEAADSLQIHRDKHIAVVPTQSAEGTSLSLLEAMSAGCATVATDVGGLSNIVIDEYNALYTDPTVADLTAKLRRLITDDCLRNRLAENAYETVKQAFSYELWVQRWKELLIHLTNCN